jgi:hypothetical protein
MRSRYKKIIAFAIFLQFLSFVFMLPVQGQEAIPLAVARTVWGSSLSAPVKVCAGDEGVPLIVEVQNLSPASSIKGVSGTLMLEGTPLVGIYGNTNASATGTPAVGDILNPSDEVAPKGFFTMTFYLDVVDDAAVGTYTLDLLVNYSIVNWLLTYPDGVPQTLQVNCAVSSAESTVTVSASPTNLESGEQVKINGLLQPAIENTTVNLAFKDPDGNKINQSVKTKLDGSFNYSFIPKIDGLWTVNASWSGNANHRGNWASTSFEVRYADSLVLSLSNDRLRAGYDNYFNITVKNDGNVALSKLDFTFTVPAPLISVDKSHWTLNHLAANESFSIPVVVYAPFASIGNTFTGGFTASCRDDYGESQTYTLAVGLVIVGNVELSVYDNVVNPQVTLNGSEVEITTTLLNRGTTPALYVNASILANDVLDLTPQSSVYIGDVDENSQAPFTLSANVSKDTPTGTYPVTLRIDYRNDQNLDNSFNYTFNLDVASGSQSDEVKNDLIGFPQLALVVAVIAVAACLIVFVHRRQVRRSKPARADR